MFYDTAKNDHGLPRDPFKAIVAPRPIGWITSMSANGEINLAPYSFFNAVSDTPPIVLFSSEGRKDSLVFIEETREFVCSLATLDLLRLGVRILGSEGGLDGSAGLEPGLALEHDEAPGRELAVIGNARGDRQQRLDLGRRRAGRHKLDGLERAPGPQEFDGFGHGCGTKLAPTTLPML